MSAFKLTRVASLKTVADFRAHIAALGLDLPIEDTIEAGASNPLSSPVDRVLINGKRIGNRIAIHPMEGWDGTTTGGTSAEMKRRWQRFGASGAKLICGAEAMAVRADGRANTNQLIINEANQAGITELVEILKAEHLAVWGSTDDLVIGFQLTHSGRFCRPNDKKKWESRVAFRHPLLDKKFNVTAVSASWVFAHHGIEFCPGLAHRRGQIVLSYGIDDREAWVTRLDAKDVENMRWITP